MGVQRERQGGRLGQGQHLLLRVRCRAAPHQDAAHGEGGGGEGIWEGRAQRPGRRWAAAGAFSGASAGWVGVHKGAEAGAAGCARCSSSPGPPPTCRLPRLSTPQFLVPRLLGFDEHFQGEGPALGLQRGRCWSSWIADAQLHMAAARALPVVGECLPRDLACRAAGDVISRLPPCSPAGAPSVLEPSQGPGDAGGAPF